MTRQSTILGLLDDEELERANSLCRAVGGPNVAWGAQSIFDAVLADRRYRADVAAQRRLLVATWGLVVATVGLVVATVGLIVSSV